MCPGGASFDGKTHPSRGFDCCLDCSFDCSCWMFLSRAMTHSGPHRWASHGLHQWTPKLCSPSACTGNEYGIHLYDLSDHLKTGQRRSGQNRPTKEAGTELFYSAESFGGKLVFVRQLRGPHLSTCP